MVVVEERVENQEIAADRRSAINRIVGVQHDVAFAEWDIHHHRPSRNVAPVKQTRREKLTLVGKAKNDAWTQSGRNDAQGSAHLLVGDGSRLPRLDRAPLGNVKPGIENRPSLRNV